MTSQFNRFKKEKVEWKEITWDDLQSPNDIILSKDDRFFESHYTLRNTDFESNDKKYNSFETVVK